MMNKMLEPPGGAKPMGGGAPGGLMAQ